MGKRMVRMMVVVGVSAASMTAVASAVAAPQDDQPGRTPGFMEHGTLRGANMAGVIQPKGSVDPHMAVRKPASRPDDMPVIKPEPASPDGRKALVPR